MDKQDIEKIEKIISDREEGREKFNEYNSKVHKMFLDMAKEAFSDGALKKKYKELIALGISLVIRCEPCTQSHTKKALDAGASREEIIEVIEIGIEMGGGPAQVLGRFAIKVLDYYLKKSD